MATTDPTTSALQLDLFREIWRPVVGYEGLYEVSNQGRVRSVDRFVSHRRASSGMHHLHGRLLAARKHGQGRQALYRWMKLHRDGQPAIIGAHRLVLEAFIGPRPPGHVCNHKDGDPTNNTPANLEWVTQQYNVQHAVDLGLIPPLHGERHGCARFTEADIRVIRDLAATGMSRPEIAKRFNTARQVIRRIVLRKAWKHLP